MRTHTPLLPYPPCPSTDPRCDRSERVWLWAGGGAVRQASTAADLRKLHSELPPDVDALLAKMAKEAGIDPATLPERMANFDRANAGTHPTPHTPRPSSVS